MKRFTPVRTASVLAIALAATLSIAGCTSSATPNATRDAGQPLRVVATTTQVGDFTQNVGGDLIDFTQLLAPGGSAHHFDPTPADLAALGEADVLVINGAGLEEFLDSAIKASGFAGVKIDSSTGIPLSDEGAEGESHESEAANEHTGETAEEHEGHEHSGGNPHIWTDPANAKLMVDNIEAGLAAADSANAETFKKNADGYNAKLDQLDTWISTNVDKVPADQRLVVSNHDAFHYFLEAYGITFVGSIIPSFEDNAEPSAAEIDALVAKIKDLGVKAIFSESSVSDKTATSIAKAAGVKVYSGEDALFGDSLGAKGSGGETYIKATIHNTTVILESWGVVPTDVPAGLK